MNVDADVHRYQRLLAERKRKKWIFYAGPWKDDFYNYVGHLMRRAYAYTTNCRHYQMALGAEVTLDIIKRAQQFSWVYGHRKHGKYIVHGPAEEYHRRQQGW